MQGSEPTNAAARWLDDCAAPPGSTVWVIWEMDSDLSPVTIASTHADARAWADQQPDPSVYRFTEWRVIGAGWPGVVVEQSS